MTRRALLFGLLLVACAAGAQAPREAHGSADVYSERGIALAWAILRGASESETSVVIRVATDSALYGSAVVIGLNPFTHAEQVLRGPAPVAAGGFDAYILRSRFADFPRTEIRLFANAAAAQSGVPALTVFYLGVPDTAPEFADRAKLESYLAARIERARSAPPKASP